MYDGFLELILKGGLPLLFLLIFLESSPFFGIFIPGQVIIILIGFIVSTTHVYPISTVLIIIFLGAFFGDIFAYFFAKKYGAEGIKKLGISENSTIYKASVNFFKKFGNWSIILGREFNLTRAFIPSLAGIFKMHTGKYLFFAFISSLLWTLISFYLGFYFGIIIVDKLNFIFAFIGILIGYFLFLYFIYNSFIKLYSENKEVITNYALTNFFYLTFLFLFFITLILINYFNLIQDFNNYFKFINLGEYITYFNFLFSAYFLALISLIIIFTILFILKDLRLLLIFLQGIFISAILTIIIDLLLKQIFQINVYISLITIGFFIFYIYYIFTHFVNCPKFKKKIEIILGSLLLLIFILKCSITENFYHVLISFIIAAIECELVLILLHFKVLDSYFTKKT